MTGKVYKDLAMRTANPNATEFLVERINQAAEMGIDLGKGINAAFGMSGEAGEFEDQLKKWIFHNKELDIVHLKKELGDVCWYIALTCEAFGWDLDEILQMNIDKLSARYHGGSFSEQAANHKAEGDV